MHSANRIGSLAQLGIPSVEISQSGGTITTAASATTTILRTRLSTASARTTGPPGRAEASDERSRARARPGGRRALSTVRWWAWTPAGASAPADAPVRLRAIFRARARQRLPCGRAGARKTRTRRRARSGVRAGVRGQLCTGVGASSGGASGCLDLRAGARTCQNRGRRSFAGYWPVFGGEPRFKL